MYVQYFTSVKYWTKVQSGTPNFGVKHSVHWLLFFVKKIWYIHCTLVQSLKALHLHFWGRFTNRKGLPNPSFL